MGYASWFKGQLEGEILNGEGWDYTNDVSSNDIFEPDDIKVMNPYQLLY